MARAPPVASKTTWSLGPRLCPNTSRSSGVERTRGPDRHASPSTTATSQKSLWTSSPMNRTVPPFTRWVEARRGERQLRMRARGTTGSVAGAANYNSGLTAHSVSTACPSWFSRSPCPSARTLREGPSSVQVASPAIFMQVQHRETAPRDRASPTGGLIYRRSGCADPQGVPVGVENADPSCGDLLVLVDEPTEQILPLDL